MNANDKLVDTLAHSDLFIEYAEAYSRVTGMPLALRPLETWQLPFHRTPHENPFCALMASRSRACAACLQSQDQLVKTSDAQGGPCTMTCAYGLCETAVPVKIGEETIGYLQTGQVMKQEPTNEAFDHAVTKAAELGFNVNTPAARHAFMNTQVKTSEELKSAGSLLSIFADHLALKGNQLVIQCSNAEPPVITKAKKFIEEHHADEISLGQVAAAVHTSHFYFCKLFRKSTGLKFTEYVSRVRMEKAKLLLLNANLRVSEIAYQVGFQSLTHFNRVFKQIVGRSPTEYRRRLHGR